MYAPTSRAGLLAAVLAVAVAGCRNADTAEAPVDGTEPVAKAQPAALLAGTTLTFVVDETISTDSHVAGAEFNSTLTADAVASDGRVVLPAGTVGGWVVEKSEADNGEGEAILIVRLLGVAVDEDWYPVEATIIASDLETDEKDSTGKTAAKIGIGAAAGAVVGGIVGDDAKDALKGATVGAAVGTVIALSTRDGSAKLPEGARLTVRLDEELRHGTR
jgi:hypothetical protein